MLPLSDHQRILVIGIMVLALAWYFESFFLIKRSGNMKRGFKFWRKRLSSKAQEYLLSDPPKYLIEPHRVNLQIVYSFIIVADQEAVICPFYRSFFPCIGYVNLAKSNPQLEYRGGISHFLAFLLVLAYAYYLAIPIFALMLIINYWLGIWSVDSYLNKRIRARRSV
jgi:hypothetical protein